MHIAFTFNLKGDAAGVEDAAEPPGEPPSQLPGTLPDDRYAEWDDIHTVRAVERALAARHQVTLVNADLDAFALLRSQRSQIELVFTFVASRYMPVEIVVSIEGWVKVRDQAGDLAWVEKNALSELRTVVVTAEAGELLGVVTAGDLTRLMERNDRFLDVPVRVFTNNRARSALAICP